MDLIQEKLLSTVLLAGTALAFAMTVGVILGVTVGFRSWVALYPAYDRRTATAEQRAAVQEAESLLRSPHTHED